MLKFGSPSITLSLLVQNCTVKAGCTVYIYIYTDTNPITLPCSLVRAGNDQMQNNQQQEQIQKYQMQSTRSKKDITTKVSFIVL